MSISKKKYDELQAENKRLTELVNATMRGEETPLMTSVKKKLGYQDLLEASQERSRVETFIKSDFTIRELQTKLPWTIRYSRDFRANPQTHKDLAHTLHHISKAAGKLHGLADDMDHDREIADDPTLRERYGKYIADLVVCALRLANTFPGGIVDLQRETEDRIENKNGVSLRGKKD